VSAGRLLGLGLLLVVAAALGACGEDEPSGTAPARSATTPAAAGASELDLKVIYDDGAGAGQTGELRCHEGGMRASGDLYDGHDAAQLCARAHGLRELLTVQPARDRMCTQIYGGPQTARVTGTLDGAPVDRRFTRTNGCEVEDFDQAAGLLKP
jgi:hypothetical protein